MNTQRKNRRSSFSLETLENRQMLSASPAIHADTAVATTSALYVSKRSALIGQTVTIKGVVTAKSGVDKGATVELLDNGKDTGLTGTLNHLGYVDFTLDAGQAVYVGTHLWRIRVLTHGNFTGSKSRQLTAKTLAPALTTASNGLELATVTAGSGAADKAGETVTVTYTGFNAANGSVFDNSTDHSPGTFSFVLDDSPEQVIAGFDQEVTGMKVGETRVAVIPSALGYNDGETRVFVVHLVSIT